MNYTKGECDCKRTIVEGHPLSDYMCPLHKASPDLYEALKGWADWWGKYGDIIEALKDVGSPFIHEMIEALAKAEGK